jgi:hypothetical protein
MAEPGRAGMFLVAAMAAFFCACIVSLRLGLDEVMVLLDRPSPGRPAGAASAFLGEFGLLGSFWRSFCAVASRPFMIASALAGQRPEKNQYVDRICSLTPGFGSANPFFKHFSIKSRAPMCSTWLLW